MPEESLLPMPTDWQRGLGIVAHPDDLEYGAAGAIAAWTSEGREFAYLLVTRGEAGIDGIAPDRAGPLRRDLTRAIRRHRPELVVTLNHHDSWGPGSWNTPDHRAVGRAALDAAADVGASPRHAADGARDCRSALG